MLFLPIRVRRDDVVNFQDPKGYGRIVRDDSGRVVEIVEQKDANPEQRALTEINTGYIAARRDSLSRWLGQIDDNNSQTEQYLTDVIAIAAREGYEVSGGESIDSAGRGCRRLLLGEGLRRFRQVSG